MANEQNKDKYPSGSTLNPEKHNKSEEKEITAIASGTRKKPSFFKRAFSDFVGEDVDSVGKYILRDVVIPATKNLIVDAFEGGLEMLLFGETRRSRRFGTTETKSIFNYAGISNGRTGRQEASLRARTRHEFDDIVFETRAEAEEVLSSMIDYLEIYHIVSVADFYQLSNISASPQDHKWGWKSLKNANVARSREGYIIEFPKTEPIR